LSAAAPLTGCARTGRRPAAGAYADGTYTGESLLPLTSSDSAETMLLSSRTPERCPLAPAASLPRALGLSSSSTTEASSSDVGARSSVATEATEWLVWDDSPRRVVRALPWPRPALAATSLVMGSTCDGGAGERVREAVGEGTQRLALRGLSPRDIQLHIRLLRLGKNT
jgi:hypothetical protein